MSNIYEDDENYEYDSSYVNAKNSPKDSLVPPPPKDGEYIYCQWCKKPVLPSQLSKDKKTRDKEIKWHYHNACREYIINELNKSTPGLMSERRMLEKKQRLYEESQNKKVAPKRRSFLEMSTGVGSRR